MSGTLGSLYRLFLSNIATRGRLIGIRKSEPAAERTRSKILAEGRKKHRITDPRTLESAGFMAVLTNLPADQATPEQILDRQKLEATACECYQVVKDEFDRLLG